MNIIPAIDLKSGQCVRLYQGAYQQVTVYADDPLQVAQNFQTQGATWLHVVDLDGAKAGKQQQLAIISALSAGTTLSIQTGGGIRDAEQIAALLQCGVKRVVLGSIALKQPTLVKQWLKQWGSECITLAVDVHIDAQQIPRLASFGWQQQHTTTLWEMLDQYRDSELRHVLCTDIGRDGTLQGPNFALYRECLARYPQYAWQASGGIHALSDLSQLADLPVAAAIIGKALYENKFQLAAALEVTKQC